MKRIILLLAVLVAALFAAAPAQAVVYPPYSEPSCYGTGLSHDNFLTRCEAQVAFGDRYANLVRRVSTDGVNYTNVRPDTCWGGGSPTYASLWTEGNLLLRFVGMPCKSSQWVGGGFTRSSDQQGTTAATYFDEASRKWVRFLGFVQEKNGCPNNGFCVSETATRVNLGSY